MERPLAMLLFAVNYKISVITRGGNSGIRGQKELKSCCCVTIVLTTNLLSGLTTGGGNNWYKQWTRSFS